MFFLQKLVAQTKFEATQTSGTTGVDQEKFFNVF